MRGLHLGLGLNRAGGGGNDPYAAYAANGFTPGLIYDGPGDTYVDPAGNTAIYDSSESARTGRATMVDGGVLKWNAHNELPYSTDMTGTGWTDAGATTTGSLADPDGGTGAFLITEDGTTGKHRCYSGQFSLSAQTATASFAAKANGRNWIYVRSLNESGGDTNSTWFNLSTGSVGTTGSGFTADISALGDDWYLITAEAAYSTITERFYLGVSNADGVTDYAGDGSSGVYIYAPHVFRSDLGGMVNNVEAASAAVPSYVPTTTAARYLTRWGAEVYDGGWADSVGLFEPQATQLLHTTNTLVTQNVTTTAQAYTLHFTGTGTVTLSGTSTAGPLVGTGTGEENRVSLTFTPTAGTLTLTVSGTVTNAQLEAGSTPTSYIPNVAGSGTVVRSADTNGLIIPYENLDLGGVMPDAFMWAVEGYVTYADTGNSTEAQFMSWLASSSELLVMNLDGTLGTGGLATRARADSVSNRDVNSGNSIYTPGVNVPFNVAVRTDGDVLNAAADGTAFTENSALTSIPELATANVNIAASGSVYITKVRGWLGPDPGNTGLEEATA